MVNVKNRFDTLRETSKRRTANDNYENSVTAHLESAAECTLIKPKTKYRIPWESETVCEKWDDLKKKASFLKKKKKKKPNGQKLMKV